MSLLLQPDLQRLADLVLIVLLAAMLCYAWRLDRGLGRLRSDRVVFERMMEEFADGARRAEDALRRFQLASDGIGREIAAQVEVASTVRGELGTVAARAGVLVTELRAETDRAVRRPVPVPDRAFERAPERPERLIPPDADPEEDLPRSRAERDLLRALKGLR